MPDPEGKLTAAQHEIMDLVWQAGTAGITVSQIWETISAGRDVTRTTILNLVDRLEKRGWLRRRKVRGIYRYFAAVDRATTERMIAEDFLDEFFEGSASRLVLSLLGSGRLKPSDIRRLRRLLSDASVDRDSQESE